MKKKKKVNKKKFIARILFLLIVVAIVIAIFSSIFRNSKKKETLSLIVDKQDITDTLMSDIYIDTNGILYLSEEDVKNIFDENLYYEESSNKIITTSGTKVAAINMNDNTIELNSAVLDITAGVIEYDTGYYIPVSELTNVYNIEVITTEDTGIILSMYKELSTVKTLKKVSVKADTSFFSTTLEKLNEGEEIIYIENAEKSGWIKVLTYTGKIGYVKEKDVTSKETKRTDMQESDFSSKNTDIENSIEIDNEKLKLENLQDFSKRKSVVKEIISEAISKEKYTVNLNLENVDVEEIYLERFIIELIPRLKEIGGNIVITNNSLLSEEFINKYGG